jgi:protein tyrosine phosphatase
VIQSLLTDDKRIYQERNRYSDILTYNKCRVKLERGVNLNEAPDSDYINACYVNSPFENVNDSAKGDRKIIASQGPLPKTTDQFWQMILEQNVTMIVSTCKTRENGRDKCN